MFTKEMQKALKADAKKLRDMTGENHTVEFLQDDLPRCDCGHLFEICSHPNCWK